MSMNGKDPYVRLALALLLLLVLVAFILTGCRSAREDVLYLQCVPLPAPLPSPTPSPTPPPVSLATPQNVQAVAQDATHIDVSWEAVASAKHYALDRCKGNGCVNFAQITTPYGLSFTDTVSAGTYCYRVRARGASGESSDYSVSVCAATP